MQTTNHRNRLEGGFWGLSVEEDASLKNSVKLREWVGVGDEVEAAVLDNRNFIRVMVGNESYLALLDPGATISLVGSRILNKYRDRLRESSGQVRGVSGVPMKVQGNLRISGQSRKLTMKLSWAWTLGLVAAIPSQTMEERRSRGMVSLCNKRHGFHTSHKSRMCWVNVDNIQRSRANQRDRG